MLFNQNAISSGGYQISNSLRFQSASSQYLSRTFSAGNQTKWTWSCWVKRGALSSGALQSIFGTDNSNSIEFYSTDAFQAENYNGAGADYYTRSTAVYRDPSSWYHIVVVWDSGNATAANRQLVYVNNSLITAFTSGNTIPLNATSVINSATVHNIGRSTSAAQYFDGYVAEMNFIDGQALTPSSFGTTDPTSGQWVAAKYTGTYGTNGFYLPFSNGTSTTTLGADSSGNGNNWTLTNFTRSAGVSDCWMTDVPSGNGGASGTQPNSNYAVLSPIDGSSQSVFSVSRTNLGYTLGNTSTYSVARSTISVTNGKWYWEVIPSNTQGAAIGIIPTTLGYQVGPNAVGVYTYNSTGDKWANNVNSAYATAWAANDVIGFAYDADGGTLTVYKNNTSLGQLASGISVGSGISMAVFGGNNSATGNINFGQRSFAYTPPSGFKALCTANLPAATIKQGNKFMDATLYTGNGTGQSIVNQGGFKPDFTWVKSRSNTFSNTLVNSVMGLGSALFSDTTGAVTSTTEYTSYNSNGFTLGVTGSTASNVIAATYVAWQWQAGQGSTSSNTNGSITSTVSVSATAGFSIVTYTGTGANATVGHGLGVAPKMVICKSRGSAQSWLVYHTAVGATKALYLNLTNAASGASSAYWNNTAPTSSVFSLGTDTGGNDTTTMVAYCFAEIAGFSKFGSYTGNGSADGPFVYTGFLPKYVMIKRTDVGGSWHIIDTARDPYNVMGNLLQADTSGAEINSSTVYRDYLSNGFKLRGTNADDNASGGSYIYMAFATNPFANSNAR